ncbi:MAG: VOC family protein [Burkholderiaceae bacterium]
MPVKPIPDGYAAVTPYLIVAGAARAIDFYKQAFGATEAMRLDGPNGLAHAEIRVGGSVIMLADESPDMGYKGPRSYGGTSVSLMLYVDDVDATVQRAIEGGAVLQRPVQDQFYGDRSGTLEDPFGHVWTIATHIEDVSPAEIDRRLASMTAGSGAA